MRKGLKIGLIVILSNAFSCFASFDLQFGDVVFQTSNSQQSEAIQKATNSKFSHVGIVISNENELMVLEGVQPVKLTPIQKWISNGEDARYAVGRLKNVVFNDSIKNIFIKQSETFIGKNYDLYFDWSDEEFYCSELVYKIIYRSLKIEVASLQKLKEFNLDDPQVKSILFRRFGNNIPYDEKVISPQAIFNSDKLDVVFNNVN